MVVGKILKHAKLKNAEMPMPRCSALMSLKQVTKGYFYFL